MVGLTLVGDCLPDTTVDSVFLVVFLTDLFLACNNRCGQLDLIHLRDPLGLELDVGETGCYSPVEDIL